MQFGLRKAMLRADIGEHVVLRAGRFYPRYGLMIANHTAAIRQGLGFGPDTETDQLEATYVAEQLEVAVASDLGRVVRFASETKDENDAFPRGLTATVATPIGTMSRVGLSYRRTKEGGGDEVQHTAGLFGAIGVSESTFVLAEIDQRATEGPDAASGDRIKRLLTSYLKIGTELTRGVVPYLQHEVLFRDLTDGTTRQDTYGVGLQWFPRPHLELDTFAGHVLIRSDSSYATAGYLLLHYYL
jgi:hypothetical protein